MPASRSRGDNAAALGVSEQGDAPAARAIRQGFVVDPRAVERVFLAIPEQL